MNRDNLATGPAAIRRAQWRDYLRAYEFNFDVSSRLEFGRVYIVETTCISPLGKRMTAQYKLSYQK